MVDAKRFAAIEVARISTICCGMHHVPVAAVPHNRHVPPMARPVVGFSAQFLNIMT
jgi:hypothetical protein